MRRLWFDCELYIQFVGEFSLFGCMEKFSALVWGKYIALSLAWDIVLFAYADFLCLNERRTGALFSLFVSLYSYIHTYIRTYLLCKPGDFVASERGNDCYCF